MVKYDHFKTKFDWNNYDIDYKNKEGENFFWDGATDIWDKKETSMTNKVGILEYFKKCVMANCA